MTEARLVMKIRRQSPLPWRYVLLLVSFLLFSIVLITSNSPNLKFPRGDQDDDEAADKNDDEVPVQNYAPVTFSKESPVGQLIAQYVEKTKEIEAPTVNDCSLMNHGPDELARLVTSVSVVLMLNDREIVDPFMQKEAYETTIASILATTGPYLNRLELVLVDNNFVDQDVIDFFQKMSSSKAPKFRVVKPNLRTTFFQQLLEFLVKPEDGSPPVINSEYVVFLSAGLYCHAGWFEGLISPLAEPNYKRPEWFENRITPVFVTPHFDRFDIHTDRYGAIKGFYRLLFDFSKFHVQWFQIGFEELLYRYSEADVISTPAFLPTAFAVRAKSPRFVEMFARLTASPAWKLGETTTLDAAMATFRCTSDKDAAIVVAPCARVGSPISIYNDKAKLDKKPDDSTYSQIIAKFVNEWIDDDVLFHFAAKELAMAEPLVVPKPKESCSRDFAWYLKFPAKDMIIPIGHIAAGQWISGAKRCMAVAPDHKIMGIEFCNLLVDQEVFYYDHDGTIRLRSGLCLGMSEGHQYVEAKDCVPKDADRQTWLFDSLQRMQLKSSNGTQCLMQMTDPDKAYKARQILMLTKCRNPDNKFFRFGQFDFTYRPRKREINSPEAQTGNYPDYQI